MPFEARRLSDDLRVAFNAACAQGDHEVALQLLQIMEKVLRRTPVARGHERRQMMESLIAAHERVWRLREATATAIRADLNPSQDPA